MERIPPALLEINNITNTRSAGFYIWTEFLLTPHHRLLPRLAPQSHRVYLEL